MIRNELEVPKLEKLERFRDTIRGKKKRVRWDQTVKESWLIIS